MSDPSRDRTKSASSGNTSNPGTPGAFPEAERDPAYVAAAEKRRSDQRVKAESKKPGFQGVHDVQPPKDGGRSRRRRKSKKTHRRKRHTRRR